MRTIKKVLGAVFGLVALIMVVSPRRENRRMARTIAALFAALALAGCEGEDDEVLEFPDFLVFPDTRPACDGEGWDEIFPTETAGCFGMATPECFEPGYVCSVCGQDEHGVFDARTYYRYVAGDAGGEWTRIGANEVPGGRCD